MRKDHECLECEKFFDECGKEMKDCDFAENNHSCLHFVASQSVQNDHTGDSDSVGNKV